MIPTLIAFGANLGDRRATLASARMALGGALRERARSGLYETAPEGGVDQPAYLNACVLYETELLPEELLDRLQETERRHGRIRAERARANAPKASRTLDLDLLLVGACERDGPELLLPHPRMLQRPFVLVPAAECAPDLRHPHSGHTLDWHARALPPAPGTVQRVIPAEDW